MFSIFPNSSKLALIAMMAKINYGGFKVFDTQFPSKHLNTLGGISISKEEFKKKLHFTNENSAEFNLRNDSPSIIFGFFEFIKFLDKS